MKYTPSALSALVAVLGCLASGCVMHTTVKDASRQNIRFATPQAAQIFYDTYLAPDHPDGHGSISVYVPLPYWHRTVSTDNVRFNAAAQTADSNHDGVISEEEARNFATQRHTRKLALLSSR